MQLRINVCTFPSEVRKNGSYNHILYRFLFSIFKEYDYCVKESNTVKGTYFCVDITKKS